MPYLKMPCPAPRLCLFTKRFNTLPSHLGAEVPLEEQKKMVRGFAMGWVICKYLSVVRVFLRACKFHQIAQCKNFKMERAKYK